MKFSELPEELRNEVQRSTGWDIATLDTWSMEDIWKIVTCKRPEQMEWLYQLLFGIPLLKARLKEAVSASNCQACGISGAWQEAIELVTRYGHHEDPQLKGAFSLFTEGYEMRAKAILHARECLK